ncbi:hypothetical protein I3843_02G014000 [Carya illinoinensis]|uniref:Netrin receptor DCC n=1 Tax=Carya illinoinensis TaxID=32201 RepID=A0A8T1R8V6_CARIL|nr:uncharacterized protein LOC122297387 [Carya illinoinensis]KAG2720112.1 hypothetical protein I3760_02G020800 [Carya illinoinensis]KAG6663346.1 hypothetical protein CIPAW_02G020000 [Carya illinoinensis]KAG6725204.1 hypothetical protein I3842_02G020400 [Carya illinoinensis]KAG7990219.1 hypothetical protein I3843_02G014000 [Carya illinoinensis]
MPTFTAIALDRLLEPGASRSVDKSVPNSKPPNSRPIPNSNLERRNSTPTTERRVKRPQITPALYATPKATPLPGSPTSFTPSPYIINHKRRGPRLVKSFSEDDVSSRQKTNEKVNGNLANVETDDVHSADDIAVTFTTPGANEERVNGSHDCEVGSRKSEFGCSNGEYGSSNGERKSISVELGSSGKSNGVAREDDLLKLERDEESDSFFDPQESLSITSNTDVEDNSGAERCMKPNTPMAQFFDAWEELSSEGGPQASLCNVDADLREMRLSLLMEIEKRKQAEEALKYVQSQWQRLRQQLSVVGLTLPAYPSVLAEGEQLDFGPQEELLQQVHVARFVSESIGKGVARAEAEMEMEALIESKNFEIARLHDRIHFYEVVNREMYQRNQDALEVARHGRHMRKIRQKWVWGSIAAAITLGTAALAWSYLPTGRGSSSVHFQNPEGDDVAD